MKPVQIALAAWIADGTGQLKSVHEAVDRAPSHSHRRIVVHIKPGIYKERVTAPPTTKY